MKKVSNKFHQGALTIITFLLIFAGIALKLEVSIDVHPSLRIWRDSCARGTFLTVACELALHLGDIVKSTRASGTRGETRREGRR